MKNRKWQETRMTTDHGKACLGGSNSLPAGNGDKHLEDSRRKAIHGKITEHTRVNFPTQDGGCRIVLNETTDEIQKVVVHTGIPYYRQPGDVAYHCIIDGGAFGIQGS